MSTDGIDALLCEREELLAQIQGLQSAMLHIDQALNLIGYRAKVVARRFANGELVRLISEAGRAGNQTPTRIMQYIIAAKGMDQSEKKLCARIPFSVKGCRKRINARSASSFPAEQIPEATPSKIQEGGEPAVGGNAQNSVRVHARHTVRPAPDYRQRSPCDARNDDQHSSQQAQPVQHPPEHDRGAGVLILHNGPEQASPHLDSLDGEASGLNGHQ